MRYRIIDLGRDYPGKITDFSKARNSFLENLPDNEYVLFLDSDEEAPRMLLDSITRLAPKFPCYSVHVFETGTARVWVKGLLYSNKVRFVYPLHEIAVLAKPWRRLRDDEIGLLEVPIIHAHPRDKETPYYQLQSQWETSQARRLLAVMFRIRDMVRQALRHEL